MDNFRTLLIVELLHLKNLSPPSFFPPPPNSPFSVSTYMIGSFLHDLPHKVEREMFLVDDKGTWGRLNSTSLPKVWAFHYSGDYKLVEDEGFRVWFHKDQYKKPETVNQLMLSCSASEQGAMWREGDAGLHSLTGLKPDGYNPPRWLREPFPPPMITLFDADQKIASLGRSRWVMWTLFHGVNAALEMFRKDYCA